MISDDLEMWLTHEGDKIIRMISSRGIESLNSIERLVYEIWVFDTEWRNGGVSQYFCNRGLNRWNILLEYALPTLKSFAPVEETVRNIIGAAKDPYLAIIESDINIDIFYDNHREQLIEELQLLYIK